MWFREYVFNVLIQPFHLLIYTILIGTAVNLVQSSVIYAVVAIGFLIPAEKLLRKFFGFDNAGTLSAAGSFAGGAMFSAAINRINKQGGGKSGSGNSGKEGAKPIRKSNSRNGLVDADSTLIGGSGGSGTGGAPTPGTPTPGTPTPGAPTPGAPTPGTPTPGTGTSGTGTASGLRDGVFGPARSGLRPAFSRMGGKLKRAGKGFGTRAANAARSAGYRTYNKAITGVKSLPKTAGRWTRKALIGGTIGGGLALAGAAVGIASGDPSAAAKYALAGGAAGYYGANRYGDKATEELAGLAKGSKTAFWGSDMKDIETNKFDREFVKSPENRDALTKALGSRSKVIEAINDGSVQALLNNGITDPAKIGKALKLRDNLMSGFKDKNGNITRQPITNPDEALQQAVATAKWNRDVSTSVYDPMSRAREVFEERLFKQIKAADTTGMSDSKITERVNNILNDMASFET